MRRARQANVFTAMLTVSDPIQIPSKTTHKDKGTKVNTFYYFISKYSVRDHCGTYRDPLTLEGLKGGEAAIFFQGKLMKDDIS